MKTFRNKKDYLEDRIQTNRSANRKQYKTNMRKESVYTTNLIACKRIMITNKSGKTLIIIWLFGITNQLQMNALFQKKLTSLITTSITRSFHISMLRQSRW